MQLIPTTAVCFALCLPLAAQVAGSTTGKHVQAPRVVDTVFKNAGFIVSLQPGVDPVQFTSDWGLQVNGVLPLDAAFKVAGTSTKVRQSGAELLNAIALDVRTRYAEPNRLLRSPEGQACMAPGSVSGLPCTISFYDGNPTPQKYYDQPLGPVIDLGGAQAYLTGAACLVAVIDTGIDATHPLLAEHIANPGYDFILDQVGAVDAPDGLDNDLDGLTDEATGHGTHIAGTIVLVNPDAMILPIRVLDSDGNGYSYQVAEAIYFAIGNGAQIINLSLGMSTPSQAVIDALDFAHEMEVEVYAAAGNTGKLGAQFPASYPTVLSVAAVDQNDVRASFSTYGPTVNVSAPGVDIYSSMPGNAWAWWSGTSMATAVASGVGSMLISIEGHGGDGPEEIVDNSASIDHANPGIAHLLGSGRIDAGATISEVND